MRVRTHHRQRAPVEMPAERLLFRCRLGMHFDKKSVGLTCQLREKFVRTQKRTVRLHVQVLPAKHGKDREPETLCLQHDKLAPRAYRRQIRRTAHTLER